MSDALTTDEMEQALEKVRPNACLICKLDVEFHCDRCRSGVCRYCVRYVDDKILCALCYAAGGE